VKERADFILKELGVSTMRAKEANLFVVKAKRLLEWNREKLTSQSKLRIEDLKELFSPDFVVIANGRRYDANYQRTPGEHPSASPSLPMASSGATRARANSRWKGKRDATRSPSPVAMSLSGLPPNPTRDGLTLSGLPKNPSRGGLTLSTLGPDPTEAVPFRTSLDPFPEGAAPFRA